MEWYYQIKGKLREPVSGFYGNDQNWLFPPIFSGKVDADSKKEAHKKINEEYGRAFPLRVLKSDLESNEFLLNIREITDDRTRGLFALRNCTHCDISFRQIDSYNSNSDYFGPDFCCYSCKRSHTEIQQFIDTNNNELGGIHPPVIYRVTNKITGHVYIGKTTQAFTLRWYQHFYQGGSTKFHLAIKSSKISDWTFEVLEKIHIPEDIKSKSDIEKLIFQREKHWIGHHDSIINGYNSI